MEQPVEEIRNRKRGVEEVGEESSGEKESDWVLEQAYVALRDKLQQRDFIGERGFSKWISPSKKSLRARDDIFSTSTRLLGS